MSEDLKNWIQAVFWIIASIGALIAAFKAISELRENRIQRIKELRWKQANLAKELLDEMFEDKYSMAAMLMLDWDGREFNIVEGKNEEISYDELPAALTTDADSMKKGFYQKQVFIRDCFDRFFYHLDRLEWCIKTDLILFEDVSFPTSYYIERMKKHQKRFEQIVFENFMDTFGYKAALKFFRRFNET